MASQSNYQIRTLPRTGEKPPAKKEVQPRRKSFGRLWGVALLSVSVLIGALALVENWRPSQPADPSRTNAAIGAAISQHIQDSHLREEMMRRQREIENLRLSETKLTQLTPVPSWDDRSGRSYGVQLDQDTTIERIYEELNGEKSGYSDFFPEEKINARLANRKWLNEQERAERLHFVKTFIRDAYERGYEVELDQNLVVTGVRRINQNRKIDIDKVLERLARQGD